MREDYKLGKEFFELKTNEHAMEMNESVRSARLVPSMFNALYSQLLTNLETVEMHLADNISKHSSFFSESFESFKNIQEDMADICVRVRDLK